MAESSIIAEERQDLGKSAVGRIRRDGFVPCVVYGLKEDPVSLIVPKRELEKVLQEKHSVITLKIGSETQNVVVREIQHHPLHGNILHIDFLRIKAGQKLSVEIPLKFNGEPPGVREEGGVFQALKTSLKITTLPKYIKDAIEIDISEMNIGDSIHVSDLKIDNFEFDDDEEVSLCSVIKPRKIEVEETEAEELELDEDEEDAEPEVITAKKSEEEEEK